MANLVKMKTVGFLFASELSTIQNGGSIEIKNENVYGICWFCFLTIHGKQIRNEHHNFVVKIVESSRDSET